MRNDKGSITVFFIISLAAIVALVITYINVLRKNLDFNIIRRNMEVAAYDIMVEYDQYIKSKYNIFLIDARQKYNIKEQDNNVINTVILKEEIFLRKSILNSENLKDAIVKTYKEELIMHIVNMFEEKMLINNKNKKNMFNINLESNKNKKMDAIGKKKKELKRIVNKFNKTMLKSKQIEILEDLASGANIIISKAGRFEEVSTDEEKELLKQIYTVKTNIENDITGTKYLKYELKDLKEQFRTYKSLEDNYVEVKIGKRNVSSRSIGKNKIKINSVKTKTSIIEKYLICEYIMTHFKNYIDATENNNLEVEYIIGGELSNKDNFEKVKEKMYAILFIKSIIENKTDKIKNTKAYKLAVVSVGPSGNIYMVPIVQNSIISAWSANDARKDLNVLLQGDKVRVYKMDLSYTDFLRVIIVTMDSNLVLDRIKKYIFYEKVAFDPEFDIKKLYFGAGLKTIVKNNERFYELKIEKDY